MLNTSTTFLYFPFRRQARSAGTFAHGGTQQFFRTQLGIFQNVNGAFSKKLESGSAVQLGEELMLRAQVKSGDGKNNNVFHSDQHQCTP